MRRSERDFSGFSNFQNSSRRRISLLSNNLSNFDLMQSDKKMDINRSLKIKDFTNLDFPLTASFKRLNP